MKKKMLSLLLAAAMVVSVCACGNSEETQKTESSETQQRTEQSSEVKSEVTESVEEEKPLYPLVDTPITVKGVYIGTNASDKMDRIVWNEVSELTGINIEWEVIPKEALATYLASGEWPDFFHGTLDNSILYDYGVLGGKFVNYLDYLDVMPHFVNACEDYPMLGKGSVMANGEMYHLLRVDNSVTSTAVRSYVDTSVLDKAGVAMPTTVEELEQALRDLKAFYGEPSFIPKIIDYVNDWGNMLYAAFGTGCSPTWDVDDNGQVYYAATTEQMRLYYTYMNNLYDEGLIHRECATLDASTIKELELSGKVAFIDRAGSSVPADENGVWHITSAPVLTSQYDSTKEVLGNTYVSAVNSFYINSESKYVKELCQMIDISYAEEEVVEGSGLLGQSFIYGIEGEHWQRNGDNTYSFFWPEEYASFNKFQTAELIWANLGRADALAGMVTDTPSNNQARQMGFAKEIIPYMEENPFPEGFLVFTEDQQYVIDNKWTEIETYVNQMRVEFITGVTDIETGWDTYIETLTRMGIDEVVAVYQEAYETLMS
ncbi:MAG: hypothetical protein IJF07_07545, partial [Lachnospiraceae bacterium]|nr:hypothetical protein [Lachnospiraceae bacterium]